MGDNKLKQLEKELAYYTSLLKNHEQAANKSTVLQCSSQEPVNKEPALPVSKIVNNLPHSNNLSTALHSSHNFHINKTNYNNLIQNKRTVVYNRNKYFKAEPALKQTNKSIKFAVNKVVSKRTIINNGYSKTNRKVAFNPESNSGQMHVASNPVKATGYDSKELLKEINFLTQLINSTENKSNVSMPNTRSVIKDVENTANSNVNLEKKLNSESSSSNNSVKCEIHKESKSIPIIISENINSPFTLNKQISSYNLRNNNGKTSLSAAYSSKSFNTSKCNLKKGIQQTLYSKVNHLTNVNANELGKVNVLNKNNFELQLEKKIHHSNAKINKSNTNNLRQYNSAMKLKVLSSNKLKLNKELNRRPAYKIVNKKSITPKFKSSITKKLKFSPLFRKSGSLTNFKSSFPTKKKSPVVLKATKSMAVYSKINNKQIFSPNKKLQLKHTSCYQKNMSSDKIKSINTKYKVINKLNSVHTKKSLKKQNNLEPKENSLILDKSDSFEFLDDSVIANLEQRLLAISTSMTTTPKPDDKHDPIYDKTLLRTSVSNTKCQKIPLKKRKILLSKYKVVNKNDCKNCLKDTKYTIINKNASISQRSSLKRKNSSVKNSAKRLYKKVAISKFSIVNKHSAVNMTPILKGKSILVQRLYKSKSTIINKNSNPVNHSAKLIKSKYLGLNKRKMPSFFKHVSYPKMPLELQKLKGNFKSFKLHNKLNRYEKSSTQLYSKGNRFSKHNITVPSRSYVKNGARTYLKQKLYGYGQAPVLLIRGTRYSLNSRGKSLIRLPSKGQTQTVKTPKRILINGKSYVRTSENILKVESPVSVNLASRVLHRSINRVLTASTKKNLTKVNTYCMFYNRFGRCNRGIKCTYIHDPSKIAVCTRFLRGTCKVEGCPFSHEVAPGKMAICSYFLVDACEENDCPYRHEQLSPDVVLCKAFVQGYCPNGKECKKAHILICPKFVLGECEMGTSCAFPHPPQKAKKAVQKETEDKTELKKEDDILLEKVARYFQPINQISCKKIPEENDTVKLFVPKPRKIEEQPAFIPLCVTPVVAEMKVSD